jgi:hypothetical protein
MTITVGSARGSSSLRISTSGRYVNLATNAVNLQLARQPIQPTTTAKAFWTSVLANVQAQIAALP